jgi:predicted SAM-dependent methyltransferase
MKSQWIKDLVHSSLGELSIFNKLRVQTFSRSQLRSRRGDGKLWVHLGCGRHYIDGMINVDVNPFTKSDLWLDLRRGLPFADGSVDAIYCCHTLEHFYEKDVRSIVRECHRILAPSAGIRIVTPDFEKAVKAYLRNDAAHFSDFPDKRESIGGRCINYLMCRDQHRLLFDFGFWEEILKGEGFEKITESRPHHSSIFPASDLVRFEYEQPDRHHSVFVETFKQS